MNSEKKHKQIEEISDSIEHIDILRKQSVNLLDKPEVHHRMSQLLQVLDDQLHVFNHLFPEPTPEQNSYLQNFFYHLKEMKDLTEGLHRDPHNVENQQKFTSAIDDLKQDLNRLEPHL